jgi:hypothetical protein
VGFPLCNSKYVQEILVIPAVPLNFIALKIYKSLGTAHNRSSTLLQHQTDLLTTGDYENEEEVQEDYDGNEFNNDFDDEEADFELWYLSAPSKLLVIIVKLIILLLTLLEY